MGARRWIARAVYLLAALWLIITPGRAAEVAVTAWTTLDGTVPENGSFRLRLLAEDGSTVWEAENEGKRVSFPTLSVPGEGTCRYYLKEVAWEDTSIRYDRAVYTLTVTKTEDQLEVIWERNGKPWQGTPAFENSSDRESPDTGDAIAVWLISLNLSAASLMILLPPKKAR